MVGISRRDMLARLSSGFGLLGLAGVLTADVAAPQRASAASPLDPKPPPWRPRARRVIFLVMNGGPSQVDTFDPKPALAKYAGQDPPESLFPPGRSRSTLLPSPFKFAKCGQ
ncbi:MAG TPA: DUF1501 domain-containing protein, partial [Pirellulales bacterium]|nr:DUF1501 domain-containing protein [Pirellulales bacterium]